MSTKKLAIAFTLGLAVASILWLGAVAATMVVGLGSLTTDEPMVSAGHARVDSSQSESGSESTASESPEGSCVIGQLLASDGPAGVDPELGHLEERLARPPFSSFTRFRFVVSRHFPCGNEVAGMPLHGGGELSFSPAGVAPEGRAWDFEARDETGRTLLRTRATVRSESPLFIVTAAEPGESLIIWVESV